MTEIESCIYMKRFVNLEARISQIEKACEVFTRGFEDGVFAFRELKGNCRFLSILVGFFDRDAGDLCRLASHAENLEQFKTVCRMSCQRWKMREARGKAI